MSFFKDSKISNIEVEILGSLGSCASVETVPPLPQVGKLLEPNLRLPQSVPDKSVRSSLKSSTLDGVFAAIFSNITGGVLLSNFLVDLHASTVEISIVAAIPLLVNLLQPLGAYLSDQTKSRHCYGLWIYGPSRLIWLILVLGIFLLTWQQTDLHPLVFWTVGVVLVSSIMGALGSASWLSWIAALVPERLRGRYFGFRNSAVSLTTLICIPLAGWAVSSWPGGTLQGYSVILIFGVLTGLISISFQFWMQDVNPQLQRLPAEGIGMLPEESLASASEPVKLTQPSSSVWQDKNFLIFLCYFGFWAFAVNVSAPFFNIYLLDNLALDVKWVTLYNSLTAGANLLMLVFWGRLSDRTGNRSLLIVVGILVAITPLFWLGIGTAPLSLWLWLPLLFIFTGVTLPAIELCSNNIQIAIAPKQQDCTYFAIAAAVAGGGGALGTLIGGSLAEFADYGGLKGMFALSSVLRLVALLPLVFVHEQRCQSVAQVLRALSPRVRPALKFLSGETLELPDQVE
jgi:MFS family permease